MSDPPPPSRREEFEIAVICALQLEANAVDSVFDEIWGENGDDTIRKAQGDENCYTMGLVGHHNVVLVWVPVPGKGSAASSASLSRLSFREIKLAFVVGICGGVPYGESGNEILLGDTIIGTAILQYDFGRQQTKNFKTKSTPSKPNREIQGFLNKLKGDRIRKRIGEHASKYFEQLKEKEPRYRYPGADEDKLYKPSYHHKHHNMLSCKICEKEDEVCNDALNLTCIDLKCNDNELVSRKRLGDIRNDFANGAKAPKPEIHFGLIASGDTVMKSGEHRDKIVDRDKEKDNEKIIAFEMEAAGVMESFEGRVIVIKSVCDYADSHKNKKWQEFAAATAATHMKAVLEEWPREWLPSRKPSQASEWRPLQICNQTYWTSADIAVTKARHGTKLIICLRSQVGALYIRSDRLAILLACRNHKANNSKHRFSYQPPD
jgi:nucleoside phosphorylase